MSLSGGAAGKERSLGNPMFGKTTPKIGLLIAVILLVLAVLLWRAQAPPEIRKPPFLPPLPGAPGGAAAQPTK